MSISETHTLLLGVRSVCEPALVARTVRNSTDLPIDGIRTFVGRCVVTSTGLRSRPDSYSSAGGKLILGKLARDGLEMNIDGSNTQYCRATRTELFGDLATAETTRQQ